MAPGPFGHHQTIMLEFIHILKTNLKQCDDDCFVYAKLDWVINDFTIIRPDVSVICKKIRKH